MRGTVFLVFILPWLIAGSAVTAGDDALRDRARTALENGTTYLRSIATEGGYLWRYSLDLQQRAGETKATASQVWIQPPGTPSVGMAFLRAHEATKDARFLDAARAAALALARGQLESGGWDYLIEFDPEAGKQWYRRADVGRVSAQTRAKLRNYSTYDDNTTQSALRFLLALVDATKDSTDTRDLTIRETLDYGLKKLLEAQYPNGAWPQRYDGQPKRESDHPVKRAAYPSEYPRTWPRADYKARYTLNDQTHRDCIATLLDAYHRTGRREFFEAARRAGDFILLAQMPEPQPVWAQQYNALMEPAWARAFEPPSVTAGESAGALRTLIDLYRETGEDRYLEPIPRALAWYERSTLGTNRWARYYELQSNRPIYGDRDGKIYYRLEDISEERQKGYAWSGDFGVQNLRALFDRVKSRGRAALRSEQEKTRPSEATLEPQVRAIVSAQDERGRWVTRGKAGERDWEFTDQVESRVFIKNFETLAAFLEAFHEPNAK